MPPAARIYIFCSIGAVVGIALWGMAWVFLAGGHGSEMPLTVFFPWAQFFYRIHIFDENTWVLIVISMLQMPLYALIIGGFRSIKHRFLSFGVIFVLHLVGIMVCYLPKNFYKLFW